MDKPTLLAFIAKAHRHTYAAPTKVRKQHLCEIPVLKGHTDHEFSEGDLRYHDSYAGSTWAPGREVVFHKENPIWCMTYQGQNNPEYGELFLQEQAFPFLKRALMSFDDGTPFRGPQEFSEGDFRYTFELDGDYEYFKGRKYLLSRHYGFADQVGALRQTG
jgi:hypothetical protein